MIADEEAGHGGEEGENYFVSMTDMMVGVLFIFIIMLMSFALDFRSTTDVQEDALKVAQEVAARLDTLEAKVREQIGTLDKAQQERRKLLLEISSQLSAEGLSVQVDEANGVLRLTEDAVRFQPSRSDLDGRNRENVGKIARVLERVLPKYVPCRAGPAPSCRPIEEGAAMETLFVEGHTDSTGADAENWQLSTARAVSTYREIIAVAPTLRALLNGRKEQTISVSGYSSTRPIDARSDRAAWERNRRIDLRFVMETDNRHGLQMILRMTDDMRGQIDRLRQASGVNP